MDKINDGGPAFSSPTGNPAQDGGLTIRDYFIAHAPKEILWKFEIDTTDMGEAPTMKAIGDWRPKQYAWDEEYNKRKWIKWPSVWADAMLKAREKN